MEQLQHYIVELRNSDWRLIGPFPSQAEAADWGSNPLNNPEDDPRWQTIMLTPSQARRALPLSPPEAEGAP